MNMFGIIPWRLGLPLRSGRGSWARLTSGVCRQQRATMQPGAGNTNARLANAMKDHHTCGNSWGRSKGRNPFLALLCQIHYHFFRCVQRKGERKKLRPQSWAHTYIHSRPYTHASLINSRISIVQGEKREMTRFVVPASL